MGDMKTKMLQGEPFRMDAELRTDAGRAADRCREYNAVSPTERDRRSDLLARMLGGVGTGSVVLSPVQFNYGYRTTLGSRVVVNVGVVFLDTGRITVGDEVLIGPGVQLLTSTHPLAPAARRSGLQAAEPITLHAGVWLGGGVIVCPGVTIGENSVVGAGSVVTKDVPAGVLAVGSPCRVLRRLDEPAADTDLDPRAVRPA